jgi:hypothetical protein
MNTHIQQMIEVRQEYNIKILKAIEDEIMSHPDLRFGQVLANLGVIDYVRDYINDVRTTKDPFHEESKVTWDRVKDYLNK